MTHFEHSLDFARRMDAEDTLAHFREQFHFPVIHGRPARYFCGNSLGLQPKNVGDFVRQELEDWANLGVEAHFHGKNPWFSYHHFVEESLARIVGAHPQEVVAMGSLTTNLHLLMVSFYRPTAERYKILCEAGAFPSDQYALESQARFHGLNPDDAIIEVSPREGEHTLRPEDILSAIEQNADSLALVLFSGVNYYTGQAFPMAEIVQAGHRAGALVGFDLAHAAGNLKLSLHDWNADFAAWCSYKYLNSSPGGVSGIFVHERHGNKPELPRFAGWWGNNEKTRFLMKKGFQPAEGAQGWQLSNAPVLPLAVHKASLELFDQAGMDALCAKRDVLTGFLEFEIDSAGNSAVEIITPREKSMRGCQLSLLVHEGGRRLFDALTNEGVIADWREPNVIRLAPAPLYNSFEDVFVVGETLRNLTGK